MRTLCFAMIAGLALQAGAQDDLNLLTQVVPPNVMILVDNSGSMSHVMWHDDFDPNVFYDLGPVATGCDIGVVPAIAGSAGFCPASGDASDQCPDSDAHLRAGSKVSCDAATIPDGCTLAPAGWSCSSTGTGFVFTLPDYTPQSARTRWSLNYLSWLFGEMIAGTTPSLPTEDRLETAKAAIISLIDLINPDGFNESARFGLSKFSSGSDPDGGSIDAPVSSGNKNSLISKLVNLQPDGWTPLAETMVDIGEYMSGDNSVGSCSKSGNTGVSNPMEDFCRRNFLIILTDGSPTKDDFRHSPGTADFICKIGNSDADEDELPTPYDGRSDAPPYQFDGTDWLDDVSHAFFVRDLRPDLPDIQNIITYTIGFTIDHPLLRDTAVNSTGEYYIATNAAQLSASLRAALLDIIERATSFTAATVPSSRTAFADGFYVAWFKPRIADPFWEGHLEAYRLTSDLEVVDRDGNPAIDATGTFIEPKNPFWDTAFRLLDPAHPARRILTTKGGVRAPFTPAGIDAADLNLQGGELTLYPNDPLAPFADLEALADAIVGYLHGRDAFDDDRDGVTNELRETVLGDIFHSNPVVVGPPPLALAAEEGYGPPHQPGSFIDLHKQRDRVLYVGANDGMLHAIDAGTFRSGDDPLTLELENDFYDMGTGNEVFGYVPGMLLDEVKYIPRNLPRSHYYVDGSPSAADVWIPSSIADTDKQGAEWTTLLVTGLRQGGDGYLALDVTEPGATGGRHGPYPKLQWELDGSAQPLGETWSEPIITRVKLREQPGFLDHCGAQDGDGDCREQWVVIVGGGFTVEGDPNLATYLSPGDAGWSDDSKAVFIIAADTGQVLARLAYDAADPVLANMTYSIPSTPAVLDLDFDGFADVIYVGDAGGQLWKWDISEPGEDSDLDGLIDSWPAGIFFRSFPEASDAGLHYRSIFFPVSAAFLDGELILAFGTGERTELPYLGDPDADENNRFYVVKDPLPVGQGSIPSVPFSESDLTDITGLPSDPDPTDLGYYFVAEDGEKFVSNHVIFAGFVITTSYLPDDGLSENVCAAGGSAFVHIFSLDGGVGFFDPNDPDAPVSNEGRRLRVGIGVPADPRISTTKSGDTQLFLQTSAGHVSVIDAPDPGGDVLDMVYWKQDL